MNNVIGPRARGVAVLAAACAAAIPGLASAQEALRQASARPIGIETGTLLAPPPSLARYAPGGVVLKSGPTADMLQGLPIKRRFEIQSLRAQPIVALGNDKVDMAPLLANPRAPFNVAERLRARPNLAQVTTDDTRVMEVAQGIVVHSTLGYRLRPQACADAASRSQVAETGARCFTAQDAATRASAFGDPADARYVANPAERARLVAEAEVKAAQARAEVAADLARFRASLQDPAQRAAVEAEVGAAEAARLATLDDAGLEREMVNRGETIIEQVMFVPAREGIDPARIPKLAAFESRRLAFEANAASAIRLTPMSRSTGAPLAEGSLRMHGLADRAEGPAAARAIDSENVEQALEPRIFLTGFTLGREYEWRQRVQTTISWCLVGCKRTYYAEAFAGFGYGFGLRFPVRVDGTYRYRRVGTTETATLVTRYEPIDGSPADYGASGLEGPKHFSGKELVAEFGGYAGVAYALPVIGSGGISVEAGMDFTEGLPAPFTHGQFRPPAPGETGPTLTKVFEEFDMAGGQANFGVAGAKVFPAVKVELHSDALRFTLNDRISGQSTALTRSGQSTRLALHPTTRASEVTLGDPVYNLSFLVTPGLTARLFVDVSVWSTHWDWPVWFPQLTVQLPPGGVDFACHAGTECRRDYAFAPRPPAETGGVKIIHPGALTPRPATAVPPIRRIR